MRQLCQLSPDRFPDRGVSWTNADRIKNGSMLDKTFVQWVIDLLLNTEDVRKAYQQGDGHTWVGCIGDEFLQEGLRHLDGQMLSIIESLVFEDMTIYEVSQHLGIDMDSVYEKIQESRRILLRYA